MKKLLVIMLLAIMVISSLFAPPTQIASANIADNSVIILTGKVGEDNTLTINALLTVNTGISGMTVELIYDSSAMTLTNVTMGKALSSLEPIMTNAETPKGYSITPFKFNYFGNDNDFSTGTLFTLNFKVNEYIGDGIYNVTLKYNKDEDVNYYENNTDIKTKNLYIDSADVEIKDHSVVKVSTVKDSEKPVIDVSKIIMIVSYVVIIAGGIAFVIFVILAKKRRKWKRI